ncbi:MAG: hypothetical protein ABII22_02380 [Candidatus Micrarchaeota archaeon]
MALEKKEAYLKQIIIYLNKRDFAKAFSLAQEFTQKFPDGLISHFFLAKSAFYLKDYGVAESEARKAFNLSNKADLVSTGILLSSILYAKNKLKEGYGVLESVQGCVANVKEVQELMAIFSLALNNPERAAMHMGKLLDINKTYADDFILSLMG